MSELKLDRTFETDAQTVFDFVTKTKHLLEWWGPEGVTISDHELDLTRPGPWRSTMVNAEGKTYKVSGEVLAVDPPNSVEFTWGWHDDKDERGHSSTVRFDVKPAGSGAQFTLTHSGLPDDESAGNHNQGWTSSLRKLERAVK